MRTTRSEPSGFAAKAKDLQALRDAVVEAATVSGALWISYIFAFLYLAIAAGAVTHKDLFFENPVKLPFLNVELPLTAFFTLGPALFLIVHAYTLLHFTMLAGKVGVFHSELQEQIADEDARARLRRQLPSNIFVQFLAGPRDIRSGLLGIILRLIAWISLILGPIALLVFFQLQFLPYHAEAISWWQRIAVVLDGLLLWALWPFIGRGTKDWLGWTDFRRPGILFLLLLSVLPVWLVFAVATFPGEWLHAQIPQVASAWTPHKLLVAGGIDDIRQRPTSLWSNRLVLPGVDLREQAKYDTEAKIDSRPTTLRLRGRRLEDAILENAYLPKADFTGAKLGGARMRWAQLQGASLDRAELQGASLREAQLQGASLDRAQLQGASLGVAQLQGALLDRAQLQGASLDRAQLQGASLRVAQLQGASLAGAQLQGASLAGAQLQGASLRVAKLEGASLENAQLQSALLEGAQLQGVSLDWAQLEGAWLADAQLQNASLYWTQLQGASLPGAQLQDALLVKTFVWRASRIDPRDAYVDAPETESKYTGLDCQQSKICDWSGPSYAALRRFIEDTVPAGKLREALARIAVLDPENKEEPAAAIWAELEKNRPPREEYKEKLAVRLVDIGCKSGGAPYVVRGLLLKLRGLAVAPAGLVATAFLEAETCPGARGLLETEKAELRTMRDLASLKRAPAEAPAQAAQ